MPSQRTTAQRPGPLFWALAFSLAVHGALLVVRFVGPERIQDMFRDVPLEVVLVNARSTEPPPVAQALAQASLAGGGDAAQGRATSPLPPAQTLAIGNAPDDARRQVEALRDSQQQLLAQIRRELASMPPPAPPREQASPEERLQEEHQRQLLRQLAQIEKRINEDNARPRRRFVSPATMEVAYAAYYDRLRRRIEERGTRDFPEVQGRKLYGELTMNLTVDAAGQVVDMEIVQPSDSPALDRHALAIVRAAAPFGPFSAAMRQEADQLVITSRFRFTRDDSLAATLSER
jgi:protein TonB